MLVASAAAEIALQSVALPEPLLHWMELAVFHEAFNSRDLSTVSLHGKHGARLNCLAVHHCCARSAKRSLTANMRAGQTKHIPQVVNQQQSRFHLVLMSDAID